jgi:hypothetical protein
MTPTLPWLKHLTRSELEMLIAELVRDLEERPASVQKNRAWSGVGSWNAIADTYGAVADGEDSAGRGPGAGGGGPAAG